MAQAVIMAGGQGERFWPLTHKRFPKYRICLDGKASLLQRTYQRLLKVYRRGQVHVVTTREHTGFIRRELPGLPRANMIVEPARNNTASAILLATATIGRRYGADEPVSFFPADHLIQNERLFAATLRAAVRLTLAAERLVLIGIRPTFPAVGFGYLKTGPALAGHAGAFNVKAFKEKPDLATAKRYLKDPRYLWNGGIFTWRAGVFLDTLARFSPEFIRRFDPSKPAASYRRLPKLSIDYALLEKADNLAVVATRMDWCDMGSWDMFLAKGQRDHGGNLIHGVGAHHDSKDSLLLNTTGEPLVALGVSGLIVVKTDQGVLVCRRSRSEEAALLAGRRDRNNR